MASSSTSNDDFSVLVLASDLGIDARPFLTHQQPEETWYDCPSSDDDQDFAHLDSLHFFRLESGSDKSGHRIFRIVGKYFSALAISAERLKNYVFSKICTELLEGPFCIVYMHSTVQKEDNNPGLTILRWIYKELSSDHKDRLQAVYFVHPGIRSRLVLATLYWKIKYVSRLQYLWDDIKKGELEIPEFVQEHDAILEHRSLHMSQMPPTAYSFGRHDSGWSSIEYMS
ncbi:unnamed protein product [Withania somnifera]